MRVFVSCLFHFFLPCVSASPSGGLLPGGRMQSKTHFLIWPNTAKEQELFFLVKSYSIVSSALTRLHARFQTNSCGLSELGPTTQQELTHRKRLWCWEGLGTGGEGDDRGWDGWMASPTRWTWVWVNFGSWWWTGRPGVLQFMGSQRVGHD